jgi:hypothetical protein
VYAPLLMRIGQDSGPCGSRGRCVVNAYPHREVSRRDPGKEAPSWSAWLPSTPPTGARLAAAKLRYALLNDTDLAGVDLTSVDLEGAVLE